MARYRFELTEAEALVLFEFISDAFENEEFVFEDHAERRVLWFIQGGLRSRLPMLFSPDYRESLARAREEVREQVPSSVMLPDD